MNAYKCDGCKEMFEGEPLYTVEPSFRMMQHPPEWHICSPQCLIRLGKREIPSPPPPSDYRRKA